MKYLYPFVCLLLTTSLIHAQLNINPTVGNVSCYGFNNGTISIAVSGGVAPYTFSWNDGSTNSSSISMYPFKDNAIFESDVNNSNGAGGYLPVGQTGFGFNTRSMLAFNMPTNLPINAQITSASLRIHQSLSSGASGTQNMMLHRMLQNWGEGTSDASAQAGLGAPATLNDATWLNSFYPSTLWTTNGGVFSSTISAVTPVANPANYFWSSQGMVNDIQFWINNPSLNYGWMFKGLESALLQAKRFDSRENSIVANRPLLSINYAVPIVFSTAQNLSNLNPGTYSAIVTDANGLTATASYTIIEPEELYSYTTTQGSTCSRNNGRASVFVEGGTFPYTYLWSNNQTTFSATNLFSGNYSVTVTDANGCTLSNSTTIFNTYLPSQSNTNITTCNNYVWNGTNYSTSGTYNYTTTNVLGCDSVATLHLTIDSCFSTLHLKLFLEGLYANGSMIPLLYNNGLTTDINVVDTITVELHNSISPFVLHKSKKAILHTTGLTDVLFSGITSGSQYYIVVKHRNNLETWSKVPVTFSASTLFNFTEQ